MRRFLLSAAFGALGTLSLAQGASALDLEVSTGFPSVHGIVTDIAQPWLDKLNADTQTEIKVNFSTAGSALGALPAQLDQTQQGLVDAGLGLAGVPPGRMPLMGLGDIPFLFPSRPVATEVLNAEALTSMASDFKGLKLVGVMVDCSVLHTVEGKPVKTLADIKGLRIRVPSQMGAALVEAAGGIPVAMPLSEVYENLQRGVLDGAVTPWDVMGTLKLGEVLKHHTDNPLMCGQLWFAFNADKYNSYPDDVKQAIDAMSGAAFAETLKTAYAGFDEIGQSASKAAGGDIVSLSAEDMAAWKEAIQPAVEKYLADAEAKGVTTVRAVYETLRAAGAQ